MSAADPTLSAEVAVDIDESPTMTCSRRYFSASAWGSSRALMIGRERVVADDRPSHMTSERAESPNIISDRSTSSSGAKDDRRGMIAPAPTSSWRLTRKGRRTVVRRLKSRVRRMRKFSCEP